MNSTARLLSPALCHWADMLLRRHFFAPQSLRPLLIAAALPSLALAENPGPPPPPPPLVAAPDAAPPAAPAAAPTVERAAPEPAPTPMSQPAVRLSVGVGGLNRAFAWSSDANPRLLGNNQPFGGDLSVAAAWFPGAHVTSGFASHLGVFGSADLGMGLSSNLAGAVFSHQEQRLRVGGAVRFPFGAGFTMQAQAGWSWHGMSTSTTSVNDGRARPNTPDVAFSGFRGGLGARVRLAGSVELDLAANAQYLSGFGELGSAGWFPDTTGFALDAGGGLSLAMLDTLRLRAGVEWQRYFLTLNPAKGVAASASSASDQYLLFGLSLQWVL